MKFNLDRDFHSLMHGMFKLALLAMVAIMLIKMVVGSL